MKTELIYAIPIVIVMAVVTSCGSMSSTTNQLNYEELSPFGASYEKITLDQTAAYNLLIVESDHYNKAEVDSLKTSGATILAYLSVGEVSEYRWYFSLMKERGFLGKNEIWDSYYIDLTDSVSYSLFFDEIIPRIMASNYDGFFLDTIDAAAPYTSRNHLESRMVQFIRQLRIEYPEAIIIQNAGLYLLGSSASSIDAVLIEDIATNYNFESQSYQLRDKESYQEKVQMIQSLSETHAMRFLIIDFAKSDSLRALTKARLNTLEYPYFINTIELNNIATGITGNNY